MKIAVEGCAHGELDTIYDAIKHITHTRGIKIDLLICCGDFQSTRNVADLRCMAVPAKYQQMCSFYKYFSGEKLAPVLTIFIGGNHEASNYLQELAYGGWVAPKIYYLGYANVINFGGLRIGGLSGIYKGKDYLKGHFEQPPYNEDAKRSAYHIRNLDVFRLKQVSPHPDIFLTHDWPREVYHHGNLQQLLSQKAFFKYEVENNTLGSRPGQDLMQVLKPSYWFSAHLHVRFAALVVHEEDGDHIKATKFLALDKCLPKRKFLQVLDIPHDSPLELQFNPEWLAILCSTNHLLSVENRDRYMPGPGHPGRWNFTPTQEELDKIEEIFRGNYKIPENFVPTTSSYDPNMPLKQQKAIGQAEAQINPQTTAFCKKLGIDDPMSLLLKPRTQTVSLSDFSFTNEAEANITRFDRSGNVTEVSFIQEELSLGDESDSEAQSETSYKDKSQISEGFVSVTPGVFIDDDASPFKSVSRNVSTPLQGSQKAGISRPRLSINLPSPRNRIQEEMNLPPPRSDSLGDGEASFSKESRSIQDELDSFACEGLFIIDRTPSTAGTPDACSITSKTKSPVTAPIDGDGSFLIDAQPFSGLFHSSKNGDKRQLRSTPKNTDFPSVSTPESSDVPSEELFVIDKRPLPMGHEESRNGEKRKSSDGTSQKKIGVETLPFPAKLHLDKQENKEETPSTDSQDSLKTQSQTKKFKRRNQSMYSSSDG